MSIKTAAPVILSCQLTGKQLAPDEAMFLIAAPDGTLVADINKQLPGRHLCLEFKRNVVELAIAQGLPGKFFGGEVKIPPGFIEKILLVQRRKAVELLCMARKSGSLTFGYEKVVAALKAGEADFILHAVDGKPGGKQKTGLNAGAIRIFSVFNSGELGKVIGRGRVVHMAILKGNINMSKSLVAAIRRIQNF